MIAHFLFSTNMINAKEVSASNIDRFTVGSASAEDSGGVNEEVCSGGGRVLVGCFLVQA
jgi:hypothetical protein